MKKIQIILILLFSLFSLSQNDKTEYFSSTFGEASSENYFMKRIIKDFHLDKSVYEVEEYFFKNGKESLIHKYFVSNKNKIGYLSYTDEWITFYENGNKKELRTYENGRLIGVTKKWYENGKPEFEGEYKKIASILVLHRYNEWDENGNQALKNGNGTSKFYINTLKDNFISGNTINGLREGLWKSNNTNFPKYELNYRNGFLSNGKIIKSETEIREYIGEDVPAVPKEGMVNFRNSIAKSIKTDDLYEEVIGKIIVRFLVDTDGKIININVLKTLNPIIDKRVVEALENYPNWIPAILNGVECESNFTLPLQFNIEFEKTIPKEIKKN